MEIVRTQDRGTLGYDIYLNADESRAVVIERYADSRSLIDHLAHIGDELMTRIMSTGSVEGETLGEVSDELLAMLEQAGVRPFAPVLSL